MTRLEGERIIADARLNTRQLISHPTEGPTFHVTVFDAPAGLTPGRGDILMHLLALNLERMTR
jgi:hypothetical protein